MRLELQRSNDNGLDLANHSPAPKLATCVIARETVRLKDSSCRLNVLCKTERCVNETTFVKWKVYVANAVDAGILCCREVSWAAQWAGNVKVRTIVG